MVTLDPSKDYYGALEISPAAGEEEIKRQYRRLALVYHPDRNPGKEAEYIGRFQNIQEAYEILINPNQREKYDVKRKKGAATAASPIPTQARRGNPFQATSNFPPPPRRTGPTARNGSHRYDQWTAPPPPPRQRTSAGKEAEERKNMFNAWQNMNQPHHPTRPQPGPHQQPQAQPFKYKVPPPYQNVGQQRPVPTPPGSSESRATANHNRSTSSENPPPASAFETIHGQAPPLHRAQTTRLPSRRTGFDPYSPDADEPPMAGPTVYRTASGFESSAPAVPSDTPRPLSPAQEDHPSAPFRGRSAEDIPFAEGTDKEKTPYPSVDPSQRKEYFEGSDLRRTSSVQDATKLFAREEAQFERRRSETSLPGAMSPSANTPPNPSFNFGVASPTAPVNSVPHPNYVDPGLHVPRTRSPTQRSSSDSESSALSSESDGPMLSTSGEHKTSVGSSGSGFEDASGPGRMPLNVGSPPPPRSSIRPKLRAAGSRPRRSPQVHFDQYARMNEPSFRSSNPDMRSPPRGAPDPEVSPTGISRHPSSGPPGPERSQSSPNLTKITSQVMFSDDEAEEIPLPQRAPKSDGANPSSPPDARIFRQDHWQNQFNNPNWASDWAKAGDGRMSPTKSRPDTRRPRAPGPRQTRSYDEKPATSQSTPLEDVENGPQSQSSSTDLDDNDAMDVDTEPPADVRRPSIVVDDTDEPSQAPRPVYAEPSRPDWRDGPTNGVFDFSNDRRSSLPQFPPPNGLAHSRNSTRPSTQGTNTKSDLNLDLFKSVRPFNTGVINGESQPGLETMKGDLSTGLPFTSQASTTHPVAYQDRQANNEDLPKPPMAPAMTLSLDKVQCRNIFSYISQYHHFQAQMLHRLGIIAAHMASFTIPRTTSPLNPQSQSAATDLLQQSFSSSGILPFWISAPGDSPSQRGFDSYMQLLKEDQRLRTHLNVAAEKYRSVIEKHEQTRDMVFAKSDPEAMASFRSHRMS